MSKNILGLSIGLVCMLAVSPLTAAETWKAKWDKVVSAAKEEGKVTIYAGGPGAGIDRREVFKRLFETAFPGIKVNYVVMPRGSASTFRVSAERRAGKFIPDVYLGGAGITYHTLGPRNAFQPLRSALILPEVLDMSKWFEGKLWFIDKPGKYALAYAIATSTIIAVNTKLVDPKDITSYKELLKPKWRGKIAVRDVSGGGVGSSYIKFLYANPSLGPEYIRNLYGMDISLSRNGYQLVDWLARGRAAVFFFPGLNDIDTAREQGLDVDVLNPQLMKEGYGVTSGANNLFLMNPAPHPNAAKVFVNWLLSRKGQESFEKIVGYPSLRVDTSTKSGLRDFLIPKSGSNYMLVNHDRYYHLSREIVPLLKSLMKR